jgi:Cu-Zn family superoxide dismutase
MRRWITVFFTAALSVACKQEGGEATSGKPATPAAAPASAPASQPAAAAAAAAPEKITAKIESRSGSTVSGEVTLTPTADGVKVVATIQAPKGGTHAVHIHVSGDCSAPDAKSAGDHFNPDGHQHGLPDAEQKHLGDLGNVTIGDDGTGNLEIEVKGANLKPGDARSFAGRALIVHEKADDGGQPVGNAGARFGCAELKIN